ncbi:Gfo/Idh/MocA family protein [Pedobacter chitinilyticus]|uniref:Gfo/Idh/MocA family oxidoreductase n=1 Tax=Pedobacter chitinilyticus TaxID=2233776 RepID=A0A451GD65_9SPHI|nr:Gfo/Idh/MocA family oxidoreductase [Pedobacter chitinilyticus]RWU10789.1 Gfo/Idh/MocA family oxidoreductase [Pedobacter chitinilyticus]
MNRRNLLKTLTLSLGATVITSDLLAKVDKNTYTYKIGRNPLHKPLDKAVTAITLGAGNRGMVYGDYAARTPKDLKIVGVAEPIAFRNERYAKIHSIPQENRFNTWEDVFKRPKFADAIIISTPDNMHYAPCMKALELGYDILLEKPIAPTEKECRDILALAKKKNRIVAVCHVLRYAPYFVKMRELIAKGAIGEVVSIQHFEPIEHIHMSHSYVRGNWHNSKETTPIILAKSCHDLDIIKWVINKPSKKIVAMGDLKWFRKENAPAGSSDKCVTCSVERDCPYSAVKEYAERQTHFLSVLDVPDNIPNRKEYILKKLETSNYGRCVYKMDNDQPDHYVTSIQFGDSVTASFSMEAFTSYHGRRTRVMGAMGDLVGDMKELVHNDFRTRKETKFIPKVEEVKGYEDHGHGGGDWLLVKDFVNAVSQRNPALLTSTIDDSIESHLMGFMAEESRKNGKVMDIKMPS